MQLLIVRNALATTALLLIIILSSVPNGVDATGGCCSQKQKTCDATWCGNTHSDCKACQDRTFLWLAQENTGCVERFSSTACSNDDDCCGNLLCITTSTGLFSSAKRCKHSVEVCAGFSLFLTCTGNKNCKWENSKCVPNFDYTIDANAAIVLNSTSTAVEADATIDLGIVKVDLDSNVNLLDRETGLVGVNVDLDLSLIPLATNLNPDILGQCIGYVASFWGEPHIQTFDRRKYDCKGHGEYIMAKAEGMLEIQGRFDVAVSGDLRVSLATGVAVKYEANVNVDIPLIQVGFAEYESGDASLIRLLDVDCPLHLYIGGILQQVKIGDVVHGEGYVIIVTELSIDIQYFDGLTPTLSLKIMANGGLLGQAGCELNVFVCLPFNLPDLLESTLGLLGTPNGNYDDEWTVPGTGEILSLVQFDEAPFDFCTGHHCVSQEVDSLFVHENTHGGLSFEEVVGCNAEYPGSIDISNPPTAILDICGEDDRICLTEGILGGVNGANMCKKYQEMIDLIQNTTDCPCSLFKINPLNVVTGEVDSILPDLGLDLPSIPLLQLASELNPDILGQCLGYVASFWGEPHIQTFDRRKYDCKGHGEFIMAKAEGKLEIQGRFDVAHDDLRVSVATGVAIKYQVALDVDIPLIQVGFAEYNSSQDTLIRLDVDCPIHLYLDGVLQKAKTGDIIHGEGYVIVVTELSIDIQYFDGLIPTLSLKIMAAGSPFGQAGCELNVFVCLPFNLPDLLESTLGLLGTPNGNYDDEWTIPGTGEILSLIQFDEAPFDFCTTHLCVSDFVDSLFVHEDAHGGLSFEEIVGCNAEYPGGIDLSSPPTEIVDICGKDDRICLTEGILGGVDGANMCKQYQTMIDLIQNTTECPCSIFKVNPLDVVSGLIDSVLPQQNLEICLGGGIKVLEEQTEPHLPVGAITASNHTGLTVDITIKQLWKGEGNGETISWISPVFRQGGQDFVCNTDRDKRENVAWAKVNTYTAECNAEGVAEVVVYVHDGSFGTISQNNVHDCKGWGNINAIAAYKLEVACDATRDLCVSTEPLLERLDDVLDLPVATLNALATELNPDILGQCVGYVASFWGEPHIQTFDRRKYDCRGHGEYVMVKAEGQLEIQGRFDVRKDDLRVSVATGVAINYQAALGIDIPIIQVGFAEYASNEASLIRLDVVDCPLHLYIGGILQQVKTGDIVHGDGYVIIVTKLSIDIQYFDGLMPTLSLKIMAAGSPLGQAGCELNVFVCLPFTVPDLLENVLGLLGTPNGNYDDEWIIPGTGEIMSLVQFDEAPFNFCTTYHCVKEEVKSLFTHEDAHGGLSFADLVGCGADYPGEIDLSNPPAEIVGICGQDDRNCLKEGILGGVDGANMCQTYQEMIDLIQNTTECVCSLFDVDPLDVVKGLVPSQVPKLVNEVTDNVLIPLATAIPDVLGKCLGFVGNFWGDGTHINTFDRGQYDCQGHGEFVMVKAEAQLEIQARFDLHDGADVSVATAVAVSYDLNPSIPKIQVGFAEYKSGDDYLIHLEADCGLHLYLDGVLQKAKRGDVLTGQGYVIFITAVSIDIQLFDKDDTPTVALKILAVGSQHAQVGCYLNVFVCLPLNLPDLLDNVLGLLGTPNGNRNDEWILPTTRQVLDLVSFDKIPYDFCTQKDNYCISDLVDSLFVHEDNHGGKSFLDNMGCNADYPGDSDLSLVSQEILDICGDNDRICLTEGLLGGVDGAHLCQTQQEMMNLIQSTLECPCALFDNDPRDVLPLPDELCPQDVVLYHTQGVTSLFIRPLRIVGRSVNTVTVQLQSELLNAMSHTYLDFQDSFRAFVCLEVSDVLAAQGTLEVACPRGIHYAQLSLTVSDPSLDRNGDDARLRQCCHAEEDTDPKVTLTFLIPCLAYSKCDNDDIPAEQDETVHQRRQLRGR